MAEQKLEVKKNLKKKSAQNPKMQRLIQKRQQILKIEVEIVKSQKKKTK